MPRYELKVIYHVEIDAETEPEAVAAATVDIHPEVEGLNIEVHGQIEEAEDDETK